MNTTGITPMEFNVLIKQDSAEEKTAGGVILIDSTKEREKHTATRGEIIALGPLAFNEDVLPAGEAKPVSGQRVAFVQHAGSFITGEDGEEYRLVKDRDILALIGGKDDN